MIIYLFICIFRVFRALNCSFHAISRFRVPRYSLGLREKVINSGHAVLEAEKVFDVGYQTIYAGWRSRRSSANCTTALRPEESGRQTSTTTTSWCKPTRPIPSHCQAAAQRHLWHQCCRYAFCSHHQTLPRRIWSFGSLGVKKSLISKVNKTMRLKWAREHEKWSNKEWIQDSLE